MHNEPLDRETCLNVLEILLEGDGNPDAADPGERVGLELESFSFLEGPGGRQPARLTREKGSLFELLAATSPSCGGAMNRRQAEEGGEMPGDAYVIPMPSGSSFQFEPGAQVEISTAPFTSLESLETGLRDMQEVLQTVSGRSSYQFAQCGTHPWFSASEIGMQFHKTRYLAMARYFDRLGPFGRQMMVQTCSMQVNLDAGRDWTTRVRRVAAANLLAPFVIAMFANSGVTAARVNGYKSHRSFIWQRLDPSRTGVLPVDRLIGTLDRKTLLDAYLDFALKAPVIYIEEFGEEVLPVDCTFESWLGHPIKNLSPSIAHFKNHLSLLFPEVRWKGYLELRSADSPPPEWQMIPALFYCGLLYPDRVLDAALDLLLPCAPELPELMQRAVYGMEDDRLFAVSGKLIDLSIQGLSALPRSFTGNGGTARLSDFADLYTLRRRTFADHALENFQLHRSYSK